MVSLLLVKHISERSFALCVYVYLLRLRCTRFSLLLVMNERWQRAAANSSSHNNKLKQLQHTSGRVNESKCVCNLCVDRGDGSGAIAAAAAAIAIAMLHRISHYHIVVDL